LAAYFGFGGANNFMRLELYSTISLFGFLRTLDFDKVVDILPDGLNIIEFGQRLQFVGVSNNFARDMI
jgi:hypothetical protein